MIKRFITVLLVCSNIAIAQTVPSVVATSREGDVAMVCYDHGVKKEDAQEWRDYVRRNRNTTKGPVLWLLISTWNYDVFVRDYCCCDNPENYKKSIYRLRMTNDPAGEKGYHTLIYDRESGCVWWNNVLIVRDKPDVYDDWLDKLKRKEKI